MGDHPQAERQAETQPQTEVRRDIIAIGASWGGVDALKRLVSMLPPALPASVFVVLHVSPDSTSVLPQLLARAGPLPARHARHEERTKPGVIYLAPPDCHMLVRRGQVVLSAGPRENRCRPAIDPLFRSAAAAYGPRVAGVVLTGAQDDGSAGLLCVKAKGGATLVQDPNEAFCADMPRNALATAAVDYCLPLAAISTTLIALATAPVPRSDEASPEGAAGMARIDDAFKVSEFTCPDCHGTLWMHDGDAVEFRCRIGHRYSAESMMAAQSDSVERAQWAAVRALEEKAALHRRLALRMRRRAATHSRFEESARDAEQHAAVLRKLIESTKQ